jgi:hypothetical protein
MKLAPGVWNPFDAYCRWCVEHGHEPPTRTWWDAALARPRVIDHRDADQREIDRERREGWTYAYDR